MKNPFHLQRRGFLRAGLIATLSAGSSLFSRSIPAATASPATGKQIVKLSKVPVGKTFNFTHSAQGMPAILFRTKTGVFAYSAICTHQGCTVAYNASSKKLKCPCHGAEFDPLKNGKPIGSVAQIPLSKLKVAISGAWIVEA
jgi:Rieske Fe-S protein